MNGTVLSVAQLLAAFGSFLLSRKCIDQYASKYVFAVFIPLGMLMGGAACLIGWKNMGFWYILTGFSVFIMAFSL